MSTMSEHRLRELCGPLGRSELRALVELATRYGYFQTDDPGESYVQCPLRCSAILTAVLGYAEHLGRGAAGRRQRALQDAVRVHLTEDCARTRPGVTR